MQKTSLVKNIIYKILLNLFNIVIPLLIGTYVYRTLGAHSIGKVQITETIYNYFFIFAVFGVYQYGLREMSRIKHDPVKVNQFFSSMFIINIATSLISFLSYLLFSYVGYRGTAYFPILMMYSINLVCNIFYVEWVNEAIEKYDFITVKTIIIKIIYVVLLFRLVKTTNDYKEYALLLILTTVLNYVVSFIYVKRKIKLDFSNITIKQHIKPLLIVVVFSNANVLYNQLDRFMLQYISDAAVSYYVMAQQMMGIINTLILSIIQVTIPRLSYLSGSKDEDSYLILLNNISKIYSAFLFPASIGLLVISNASVLIYGGAKFASSGPVLAVFSIYMISVGIESIQSNQIIYVKRKENVLVKLVFICGLLNLLLKVGLLQMKWLSPTTAIVTTTIANFLLLALENIFIRKSLKMNYSLFNFSKIKYLYFSLLFIPISFVIKMFFTRPTIYFFVTIMSCVVVYGAILLFTKDEVLTLIIIRLRRYFSKYSKT
jgi:O-antigen/teichoic acid export membrane protein